MFEQAGRCICKMDSTTAIYENTTIVISGDHLTMDSDFCNDVSEDYERSVYNVFINLPEGLDTSFEKTHSREFATLDMFPTTLGAMGVTIEGDRLALGVNLFSDEQTLTEQYGRKGLDKELMKKSKFYDMLINDVDIDALQKSERKRPKNSRRKMQIIRKIQIIKSNRRISQMQV